MIADHRTVWTVLALRPIMTFLDSEQSKSQAYWVVKADAKILEASLHSEVLQQTSVCPKKTRQEEGISVSVFYYLLFNICGMMFVFIAIDTGTQCWRDLECWQRKG